MIANSAAPRTFDETASFLKACSSEGTAVRIEGGNTLHAMGNALNAPAVTLSITHLSELIAHEYHDLTCAVQAGIRIDSLNAALAQRGQFIPFDAPLPSRATAGGTVAAGWLGPRRHFYARTRDVVIGSEIMLADGTLVRAGGMVVKNVTGYDMSKLYAGSFGTLGVIMRLNMKTFPIAPAARLLIAPLPEATAARAIAHVWNVRTTPAAVLRVQGFRKTIDGEDGIDGRLLILLEGSRAVVDRATLELRSAIGRAGVPDTRILEANARETFQRAIDSCIACLGERSVTFRLLGDPSGVFERAASMHAAAGRHGLIGEIIADVMNGDLFLRVSDRDSRSFTRKIEPFDDEIRVLFPSRVIVAGDAPVRSTMQAWGAPPVTIALMRRMKQQFDPRGILNPGRYVGGI